MKSMLHKILSIAMAFVVLLSTMSFTISKHYCGDTLVDTSLFREVKSCGMEMQNSSSKDCSVIKKNCCSEEQELVKGQDDLKLDFTKLDLQQKIFVSTFVFSYINLFESVAKETIQFKDYSPPLIVKDIYILDEVYLI
ncbi:HYC_CC_PP family protein [Pontimicrobium aquaticum]|uniref:Secreted protein n=2 Tax=Pontimicrobium aquaticum TaxID=2565367 RepID=A0A4U0EYJ6_9FLAO|nr:hypothetical protein E5167_03880 [Pontimicrobium aquaticum]